MLDSQPIGVNFIVGSMTPNLLYGESKNPSFNVVYLDPETMLPVDLDVYAFDLEYANNNNRAKWMKSLSYRDSFGMKDLSPKSFKEYADKLFMNETEAVNYLRHRTSDYSRIHSECNRDCRLQMYC